MIASDLLMAVCLFTCIFDALSAAVFPHPCTRTCLCSFNQLSPCSNLRIRSSEERTFNESFLENLCLQCPQGKGFTAKWIRLCRLRSWLRLKDCGHWSHLNSRSSCCPTFEWLYVDRGEVQFEGALGDCFISGNEGGRDGEGQ
jgi:hypothetical protein